MRTIAALVAVAVLLSAFVDGATELIAGASHAEDVRASAVTVVESDAPSVGSGANVVMPASTSSSSPLLSSSTSRSLARLNFLVGVAQVGAQQENGTLCGRELETLLKAIERKEFWSLKVLDSFGAPPKSFSWGNHFWFASQRMCTDLNEPYVIAISEKFLQTLELNPFNVTSPFPMRFSMIYMRFKTSHFIDVRLPFEAITHIGLCLPQSCPLASLQRYTDAYFQRGEFVMQRNFDLQMEMVGAREPSFGLVFFQQTGTIISIAILTTLLALIGLAKILHRSKEKLKLQQFLHTKAPTITTTTTICGVHIANVSAAVALDPAQGKSTKSSTLEELLLCFRWAENWRRALQPERANSNSNFLGVIAGLRTIICLWVSTFHVYYYSVFALSNAPMMFAVLGNFLNQPILQAIFFVDIFFVMSALLLVHNFLSNDRRLKEVRQNSFMQNSKLFGKLVLYRYLRLTPVLIVMMLLDDVVFNLINSYTPFYLGRNSGFHCKQSWWYNLLYIQNFIDMKDICCSWSWYLACELQFYILITALLFLYAKNEHLAKIVFVTLALGFPAIGWLCNYSNGITFDIDVLHSTLNELYIKPWVRINPYLGGALCGWLLHYQRQRQQQQQRDHNRNHNQHHQQQQQNGQRQQQQPHTQSESRPQMHTQHQQQQQQQHQPQHQPPHLQRQHSDEPLTTPTAASATATTATSTTIAADSALSGRRNFGFWHAAFWLFVGLIYLLANFMPYWHNTTPTWLVATIMSFGKLLFALTIGGAILMCAWGYGGLLNRVLSSFPFRLLNKFCFSIYLLAPLVTLAAFGLRNEPTQFNEISSGTNFIAVIVLTLFVAVLTYVLVELPLLRVCNRLLNKR